MIGPTVWEGGFAAYGIYPEHREEYAFHIFFDDNTTRRECEAMLKEGFELETRS